MVLPATNQEIQKILIHFIFTTICIHTPKEYIYLSFNRSAGEIENRHSTLFFRSCIKPANHYKLQWLDLACCMRKWGIFCIGLSSAFHKQRCQITTVTAIINRLLPIRLALAHEPWDDALCSSTGAMCSQSSACRDPTLDCKFLLRQNLNLSIRPSSLEPLQSGVVQVGNTQWETTYIYFTQ